MKENDVSKLVIGAAIDVHRTMGPGLLESVYQECLKHELGIRNITYESEVQIKAEYKGLMFDSAYRMDLVVSDTVVLELKVVEHLLPVHEAQLLSYLRLTGKKLGLLINFNTPILKSGIKRVVNGL
ncbi:MAG: GxxExxY protein [Gammaproteobacteria bacterium]|nr:GxxExxY protein [Gammaproteobacteria bacterium]